MDYIGKIGIFIAEEDKAWGHYAGKECRVLAYDDENTKDGLIVIFSDAQRLTIQIEEFDEIFS